VARGGKRMRGTGMWQLEGMEPKQFVLLEDDDMGARHSTAKKDSAIFGNTPNRIFGNMQSQGKTRYSEDDDDCFYCFQQYS